MPNKDGDTKRQAKQDYDKAFQAVRSILLKHWDPLGVKDEPKAQDDYNPYAAQLVFLAKTGASEADLSGHLAHLEASQMGLSGKEPRHHARRKKSAEAVLEYFQKQAVKRASVKAGA